MWIGRLVCRPAREELEGRFGEKKRGVRWGILGEGRHTTLKPTHASARLMTRLSCAQRLAAWTSFVARSVRF